MGTCMDLVAREQRSRKQRIDRVFTLRSPRSRTQCSRAQRVHEHTAAFTNTERVHKHRAAFTNIGRAVGRLVRARASTTKLLCVRSAFTEFTKTTAFTNKAVFTNGAAPRSRTQPRSRTHCVHAAFTRYGLVSLRSRCVLRSHCVQRVHRPLRSPENAFTCN